MKKTDTAYLYSHSYDDRPAIDPDWALIAADIRNAYRAAIKPGSVVREMIGEMIACIGIFALVPVLGLIIVGIMETM